MPEICGTVFHQVGEQAFGHPLKPEKNDDIFVQWSQDLKYLI
jgi:hypothetical protein